MKQLNSNTTRFRIFYKILVIQPVAEVYGESNEDNSALRLPRLCHVGWLYAYTLQFFAGNISDLPFLKL